MLENLNNYNMFAPIAQNKQVIIKTEEITFATWESYYIGLLNILKDGIELPEVHSTMITLIFPTKEKIRISIPDLYLNLILWYPLVSLNYTIEAKYLFIKKYVTARDIKKYIEIHKRA